MDAQLDEIEVLKEKATQAFLAKDMAAAVFCYRALVVMYTNIGLHGSAARHCELAAKASENQTEKIELYREAAALYIKKSMLVAAGSMYVEIVKLHIKDQDRISAEKEMKNVRNCTSGCTIYKYTIFDLDEKIKAL